jgi:hypothetical protein
VTAADGIGRPRTPEVVDRDERVLAIVREHDQTGVRTATIRERCSIENSLLVVHSLNRLRREGKVERRDGYRWWPLG